MKRELLVSVDARSDIAEAITWLRERSPHLPVRFGIELEAIFATIVDHPELYPVVYRRFRRALLRRFPYSVFYVVVEPTILVIGVVHQARDDSTWKRRA